MKREMNMTRGNPMRLILTFAVPLMIGNLGQQLYTIVDSIVVGRGVGVKGLAAVGATDWTYWLFVWAIYGLAQGFSIPIAQQFGKGDRAALQKALSMSVLLSVVLGAAMSVFGLLAIHPILDILQTPEDIYAGAASYLTVMLGGIIVVMAYNTASAILRAFGDSRTPLIAMAIAAVTNIILDLLFVLVFHWGIVGAAAATVMAQFIAFGYCGYFLLKTGTIRMTHQDWKPDWPMLGELCKNGFALASTQILIAVGGMILQSAINRQGSVFIAGVTATNKLLGMLESSAISLGYAITTYMAQNCGAKLYKRLHTGLRAALIASLAISAFIALLMIGIGKPILRLFIDPSDPHAGLVLAIAYRYLFIMSCLLFSLYILHVFRNALQGIGCSAASIVSGLMEFAARVSVALVFSHLWGETVLYFTEPFAWVAAAVSLVVMGMYRFRKLRID